MSVQKTYPISFVAADLVKADFETLIDQKGRDVILETALECPCKSAATNQQSTCKNCGGTGWLFINPKETRMVLSAVNIVTDYKPWSEEMRGTVNITCKHEDRLSYMDKITAVDGEAIFNEVLFFRRKANDIFTYSTYNIKETFYVGLYQGDSVPLKRLIEGEDYSVDGSVVRLLREELLGTDTTGANTSITIRYMHAPEFHVIEMKRETMETFEWKSNNKLTHLPLSAIGRRAHYQLKANNLQGDRLINNSYKE